LVTRLLWASVLRKRRRRRGRQRAAPLLQQREERRLRVERLVAGELLAVDEQARELAERAAREDVARVGGRLPLRDDLGAQGLAEAREQPLLVAVALGDEAAHHELERAHLLAADVGRDERLDLAVEERARDAGRDV
jgi:hypothetical protein